MMCSQCLIEVEEYWFSSSAIAEWLSSHFLQRSLFSRFQFEHVCWVFDSEFQTAIKEKGKMKEQSGRIDCEEEPWFTCPAWNPISRAARKNIQINISREENAHIQHFFTTYFNISKEQIQHFCRPKWINISKPLFNSLDTILLWRRQWHGGARRTRCTKEQHWPVHVRRRTNRKAPGKWFPEHWIDGCERDSAIFLLGRTAGGN